MYIITVLYSINDSDAEYLLGGGPDRPTMHPLRIHLIWHLRHIVKGFRDVPEKNNGTNTVF